MNSPYFTAKEITSYNSRLAILLYMEIKYLEHPYVVHVCVITTAIIAQCQPAESP